MRLTCGHQHATPPSPGRQSGQCTNAPTIGGNKIEVKLTAKLEKGSGSAALGKQGGKSKWRAFWESQCHSPGSVPSLFKINFYWSIVALQCISFYCTKWICHTMKIVLLCLTLRTVSHGLYPARLLCLWNFLGQNTGVGSIPFSRGSSRPRDGTQVSFVADGLFTTEPPPGKPWAV